MSMTLLPIFNGDARRHAAFVAFILVSAFLCRKALNTLVIYSLHDDSSSHIILIPFITSLLLYMQRKRVFSITRTNIGSGIGLATGGVIFYWLVSGKLIPLKGDESLSLETFSIILVWVGGFLLCYGFVSLRAGAFSLLFLLLMVPLPDVILDRVIYALQEGSTEVTYMLFQALGTPVLRQGFLLTVPGVTIEVAKECSSIRSSVALFITCLLAAHFRLRTPWKATLFVLLAFPVAVLKNGIRIATLTLLSIHVDPSFLTGNLHKEGGFVFFFVGLLILWPVFLWFAKSDNPRKTLDPAALVGRERWS